MTHILVAEDSFALANLLDFVLKSAGFEVDLRRTGGAALKAGMERSYDLILLDQQMPLLTGVGVIEALRTDGPNQSTPIFLCTAKTHELDLEDIQGRLAVTDIFHKPFSPKNLVERLKTAIPVAANG
ncbi:response regulator [Aureliella helgolandensis]|uniref:Sensory transduction protein regX3 n=1 Tax=Aureliella helgolandensis TaxID=2527968 RepID=A0A518GHR0_9BACT|nr:response regulator [Aureliella helgolandensis]QDV28132.1 Sensory transduction protein regX3 [Aureliella helgolandensis]